jgi:hypothetical protein
MTAHVPPHARSPTLQVHSKPWVDEGPWYQTVRALRWPEGIQGPSCQATHVMKRGFDEKALARQRSACQDGAPRFDDRPDPRFAGPQHPLQGWVWCLYVMGVHVANDPMAYELEVDRSDGPQMTTAVRAGRVKTSPQ